MSAKQYHVKLNDDERQSLRRLTRRGKSSARELTRARILLLSDKGQTDEQIVAALQTSLSTIARVRQRFAQQGIESIFKEKPRPGRAPKLSPRQHAQLTALACTEAPTGRTRWSLRLLADQLVKLEIVESISYQTIAEALKKTS